MARYRGMMSGDWLRMRSAEWCAKISNELVYESYSWSIQPPINSTPFSVPRGIVDSYSTLPWVMWEAVTVVEGIT